MSLSRNQSTIIFIVILSGFIIGISLAFQEGLTVYYIGYSILGGMVIFIGITDLIVSLPSLKKKSDPSSELSRYMGKNDDGSPPRFIKKIKERAF